MPTTDNNDYQRRLSTTEAVYEHLPRSSSNVFHKPLSLPMSDHRLRLLRDGDAAAFRGFVEEHHRRVIRLVTGFVQSPEDAEDIAQEVFVEAYHSLPSFTGASSLSTWLHRIAVNKSLDFLRAQSRRKRSVLRVPLLDMFGGLVVDPADTSTGSHPGATLENAERARVLAAAIGRLAEQQRVAFVLCEVDGLSMKEAADVMDISAKAVESLLSRARSRLRTLLRRYYEEE
jgi:RNA polymerase sigma factor (sigma-70 family)